MNTRTRIGFAVWVVLMAAVIGFSLVQAVQQTGAFLPQARWAGQYVQRVYQPAGQALNVGEYASITFNTVEGIPYISYYDATHGDLMLASPIPKGGSNCGVDGNWWCRPVDEAGDVGRDSSIAFWSDGGAKWKIGISYHDQSLGALKYAEYRCIGGICAWDLQTIRLGDTALPFRSRGHNSSLKFGSDGTAHIAYRDKDLIDTGWLRHAYYIGSGGNCGVGAAEGKWECTLVDTGAKLAKHISLDLDNENRVHIAYYDELFGVLKHAYFMGFGGNCGDLGAWKCDVVDGLLTDAGLFPSVMAPMAPGEKTRIAYYDKTDQMLRYAIQGTGDLLDCGIGWDCTDVDEMGSSLEHMGISMVLDQDDQPIIAFQQVPDEQGRPVLRLARPYLVYDDGEFGNCGEPLTGDLFTYWRCSTLDRAGAYVYEADYVSLAVAPSGQIQVAYSETDEYYDVTSLKVIFQVLDLYIPAIYKGH